MPLDRYTSWKAQLYQKDNSTFLNWRSSCQVRYITTRYGVIRTLFKTGRKGTVLLLHGNSTRAEVFRYQIPVLIREGFGILAPDLPGHGGSSNAQYPMRTYSFPGYATAIEQLMARIAVSCDYVIGWSLGGHVALELLTRSIRYKAVIIFGTPPVKMGPAALEGFYPSPEMSIAGKRICSPRDIVAYGMSMFGERELHDWIQKALKRTDPNARFWMVRNGLSGVGSDQRQFVTTDRRPLALLHGKNDPFVSIDYLLKVKFANLWNGCVQVVENAGHAVQWQKPEEFNRIMLAFLKNPS